MLVKKLILLALLSINTATMADSGILEVSAIKNVYDGSTFRAYIKNVHPLIGDNIKVRVAGIGTPEIKGKCADEIELAINAREFARSKLYESNNIILKNVGRGKYFRIIADVVIDGKSLNEMLLKEGLAYKYGVVRRNPGVKNNFEK
jgi:endonuclease YncB( thermonuclease family)